MNYKWNFKVEIGMKFRSGWKTGTVHNLVMSHNPDLLRHEGAVSSYMFSSRSLGLGTVKSSIFRH